MILLLSFLACKNDLLLSSGELGRLNYTIVTGYQIDGVKLNEAKLAVGYPQRIDASLTLKGWKMVEENAFLVYHSSPDDITVDSESLLNGELGVPGFSVQADAEGTFLVESKLQEDIVDQIHLQFVKPDDIGVISWIRSPDSEEFVEKSGDVISVGVGAQAAFIPIPMHQEKRIVGELEVDIDITPPEAAVVGYNIESVGESGVEANSSPASIYFVQAGELQVCATDTVNEVTSCQDFLVE
jgi:hypothetical protein